MITGLRGELMCLILIKEKAQLRQISGVKLRDPFHQEFAHFWG